MPSDIIAGLVLLRQRQRAKRNAVLDEVSPRAGHVPTLPSTEAVPAAPRFHTPLPSPAHPQLATQGPC